MLKESKKIELYRKIKQGKRVKYEVAVSSFDYKPADGIWFVNTTPGCISRECIIPLKELPKYMPILYLIKHKENIIKIMSNFNGKSINDIANEIILYLSKQCEVDDK